MLISDDPKTLDERAAQLEAQADGINAGGTERVEAIDLRNQAAQLRRRARELRGRKPAPIRLG